MYTTVYIHITKVCVRLMYKNRWENKILGDEIMADYKTYAIILTNFYIL